MKASEMQRTSPEDLFADVADLKVWASKAFFGGHEIQSFDFSGTTVVVLIGQPTSGLLTSEIYIYASSPRTKGKLGYILNRARIWGFVSVKREGDDLLFKVKINGQPDCVILIVPGKDL